MNLLTKYGLNEYFIKEASMYPKFHIARVIAQYKNQYRIITEKGETLSEVSGKFINNAKSRTDFPVVGDFVLTTNQDGTFIIHQVLKRRTLLTRGGVENKNESKLIASNLDIIFIVMSLNQNFNLNRLERYISIVYQSGAIPIILLSKEDLCKDIENKIFEVQCIAGLCDIITTSIYDEMIEEKIYQFLKQGMTAAFVGSSGVGKSSIINKLLKEEIIDTKEIGKEDRGRHTTTVSNMFLLSNNSIVIDTPGIREISLDDGDLSQSFSDIEELARECKFSNCSHEGEKGCAVIKAVNDGVLNIRRYENYLKLKREESYSDLSFKEIEVEKHERMFKDIGGMKNFKRFIKNNDKRNV